MDSRQISTILYRRSFQVGWCSWTKCCYLTILYSFPTAYLACPIFAIHLGYSALYCRFPAEHSKGNPAARFPDNGPPGQYRTDHL